jgi:hypothetical protein
LLRSFLYISNNSFSGTVPNLAAMTALQFLSLSDSSFSGSLPLWLTALSRLRCAVPSVSLHDGDDGNGFSAS